MKIRIANANDAANIFSLDELSKQEPARKELILRHINSNQCLVAELDNVLVGFLIHARDFFDFDFVKLIVVAVNYRRQGIAKALIKHILTISYPNKLFISCNLSNLNAQRLFIGCGFSLCGVISAINSKDPEIIFVSSNH